MSTVKDEMYRAFYELAKEYGCKTSDTEKKHFIDKIGEHCYEKAAANFKGIYSNAEAAFKGMVGQT